MKISSVNQLIDKLINYISEKHLVANDKMPTEKELCQKYGIGRSTVREAYKVMQARGIVYSIQGKAVFVADTYHLNEAGTNPFGDKKHEFQDYMDVRTAIEKTAVRLAIQRATSKQIERLEEIELEFEEGIQQGNIWIMADKDEQFHQTIAAITGNPLLIQVATIVANYFRAFRIYSFKNKENRQHAVFPHQMIIKAFQSKNQDLAELIMTQHMSQSYDDLSTYLNELSHNKK